MNKSFSPARRLGELISRCLSGTLARQGFASTELLTHWNDIVGPEIAQHAEPIKIQWPRSRDPEIAEPATLVLRVEGPVAIEIQHLSGVILERVNRFFGWRAVSRIALRQAPLLGGNQKHRVEPDPARARAIAATLADVENQALRDALARLGAAIKRT